MQTNDDFLIGKAGEYLVCADLISKGFIAYLSGDGLHYDVIVDFNGKLIKIQVKATRTIKPIPQIKNYSKAYIFNVRRMGKGGKKYYNKNDVDIFALVALDIKKIAYILEENIKSTLTIRDVKPFHQKRYSYYFDELTFDKCLNKKSDDNNGNQ